MDWKATLEEILAERRQELGEPPSLDDLVALRAGELSDDERHRLLEHASVDPEVSRELFDVLRFPRPSSGEDTEADEHVEADEEGAGERWQALRQRLVKEGDLPARPTEPVPAPSRLHWLPLAAMFLFGVAASLLLGRLRDDGVPDAAEPRINLAIVELLPVGDEGSGLRGAPELVTVTAESGGLVLALAVPELATSPERGPFSLEIARAGAPTSTLSGLSPGAGGVFLLDLPRAHLGSGLHELRLLDREGRPVARFQLEVELRR